MAIEAQTLANEDLDEEALFSRDFNGQLVRLTAPTEKDYAEMITIKIDERPVTVPKATPTTDAQGNIVRGPDGTTIPRATTIFDAALKLFVANSQDTRAIQFTQTPIPVLCHVEHLRPVAVCRVCAVLITRRDPRTGELKQPRKLKLSPACQHRVEVGMEVHTTETPATDARTKQPLREQIRAAVKVLAELLVADHLHPDPARDEKYKNELKGVAERFDLLRRPPRFEPKPAAVPVDDSSPAILVDHNNCILCDRCIRACSEVKPFKIIGRTGKGWTTRIGFDLNQPMGKSDCRTCGECMISCPTGALTFRNPVHTTKNAFEGENVQGVPVTAKELAMHPLFRGISYTFLKWTEGSIIRRKVKPGEVLCEEGDFGASAFVIERGKYEIRQRRKAAGRPRSLLGLRLSRGGGGEDDGEAKDPLTKKYGKIIAVRGREAIILGEMSALTNEKRTASILCHEEGEVMQMTRNVIHMLQRNTSAREILDKVYKDRGLDNVLMRDIYEKKQRLFDVLAPDDLRRIVDFLRLYATLVRVAPGQAICRENERADDFYIIHTGFVKVSKVSPDGREVVVDYLKKGAYFGEIALMTNLRPEIAEKHPDGPAKAGRRLATCTALDHVELVRVAGRDFNEMLKKHPQIAKKLSDECIKVITAQ
jgi:CRP-like cAMP-binding protein/NAD-dependent dihydropyrimidine dehydrogenase PreA subunit